MAIGGSGGSLIFGAIFQVLLNMDWGMNLSEAIERGRLHNQLYPETTIADNIYDEGLLDALRERGHNLTSEFLSTNVIPLGINCSLIIIL
jgi:gamma-glutamyltranspeptidase / glutathione hydrolase / leukotriene-C4 hydrolase